MWSLLFYSPKPRSQLKAVRILLYQNWSTDISQFQKSNNVIRHASSNHCLLDYTLSSAEVSFAFSVGWGMVREENKARRGGGKRKCAPPIFLSFYPFFLSISPFSLLFPCFLSFPPFSRHFSTERASAEERERSLANERCIHHSPFFVFLFLWYHQEMEEALLNILLLCCAVVSGTHISMSGSK